MNSSTTYNAAVRVCAYCRESVRVIEILRNFDFNGCDELGRWVRETNYGMTIGELWTIALHFKPEFNPEQGVG